MALAKKSSLRTEDEKETLSLPPPNTHKHSRPLPVSTPQLSSSSSSPSLSRSNQISSSPPPSVNSTISASPVSPHPPPHLTLSSSTVLRPSPSKSLTHRPNKSTSSSLRPPPSPTKLLRTKKGVRSLSAYQQDSGEGPVQDLPPSSFFSSHPEEQTNSTAGGKKKSSKSHENHHLESEGVSKEAHEEQGEEEATGEEGEGEEGEGERGKGVNEEGGKGGQGEEGGEEGVGERGQGEGEEGDSHGFSIMKALLGGKSRQEVDVLVRCKCGGEKTTFTVGFSATFIELCAQTSEKIKKPVGDYSLYFQSGIPKEEFLDTEGLTVRSMWSISRKWVFKSPQNDHFVKLHFSPSSENVTPERESLTKIAKGNMASLFEFLITPEVTQLDHKDRNIYHLVCKYGRGEVLEAALEKKIYVNPMGRDCFLQSPLHYASGYGSLSCAILLLKKGVFAGGLSKNNHSAAHYLAMSGKIETEVTGNSSYQALFCQVLALLQKQGCNLNSEDASGMTPVDIAFKRKHIEIFSLFACFQSGIALESGGYKDRALLSAKTLEEYCTKIKIAPKTLVLQRASLLFTIDRHLQEKTDKQKIFDFAANAKMLRKKQKKKKHKKKRRRGKDKRGKEGLKEEEEEEEEEEEGEEEGGLFDMDDFNDDAESPDYFDPNSPSSSGYFDVQTDAQIHSNILEEYEASIFEQVTDTTNEDNTSEDESEESNSEEDEEGGLGELSAYSASFSVSGEGDEGSAVFSETMGSSKKSNKTGINRLQIEAYDPIFDAPSIDPVNFVSDNQQHPDEAYAVDSVVSTDSQQQQQQSDEAYTVDSVVSVDSQQQPDEAYAVDSVVSTDSQQQQQRSDEAYAVDSVVSVDSQQQPDEAYTVDFVVSTDSQQQQQRQSSQEKFQEGVQEDKRKREAARAYGVVAEWEDDVDDGKASPTPTTTPLEKKKKEHRKSMTKEEEEAYTIDQVLDLGGTNEEKKGKEGRGEPAGGEESRETETIRSRFAQDITQTFAVEQKMNAYAMQGLEEEGGGGGQAGRKEGEKTGPGWAAPKTGSWIGGGKKEGVGIGKGGRESQLRRSRWEASVRVAKYGNPLKREENEGEKDAIASDNWIERFHRALQNIRRYSKSSRKSVVETSGLCVNPLSIDEDILEALLQANTALIELEQDFISTAKTYGKIIISERFSEKKTIAPVTVGGIAGGEKYIVHNILFKFAGDFYGLYDGDHGAAKVAGHELKGVICYFNVLFNQNVRLPMITLVDYFGFRLIVMSLLPIDRSTLIYGTSDGGKTTVNKDEKFNAMMERTANRMNIQSHYCGLHSREGGDVLLHSAADVEGHLGTDGNYYLLDFSRVMPPCPPDPSIPGSHLFYLFRPEFVLRHSSPLCPDAFSGFMNVDPKRKEYNEKTKQAAEVLMGSICVNCSRKLKWIVLEAEEKKELTNFSLVQFVHSEGVNIRFLGLILGELDDEMVQAFILCEILARIIKNEIRALLRETMKEIRKPMEASYRNAIVQYLNLVLIEKNPRSTHYWNSDVKAFMCKYYHVKSQKFTDPAVDLRDFLNSAQGGKNFGGTCFLLERIAELSSLSLSLLAPDKVRKSEPLKVWDVEAFTERIKHMNVIADTQGINYTLLGLRMQQKGELVSADFYLSLAVEKFIDALRSNPTNPSLLEHMAICYAGRVIVTHILKKNVPYELRSRDWPKVKLDSSDPEVAQVDNCFLQALDANMGNSVLLSLYASFLLLCDRRPKAEVYYLRLFENDPLNSSVLEAYADLMDQTNENRFASLLRLKIRQLQFINPIDYKLCLDGKF